jgi:hypothetical protein
MEVTPTSGKGTLGTWWFLRQARARLDKTEHINRSQGQGRSYEQFRGQPDMLPKIPLCCLWLAVKAQRMIGQLAAIAPKCRTAGKDLLLSCAGGCFAGLGIGFFLFLRLGFPATEELAGYMVGLFLVAGLKLGFSLGIIHAPRLYYHSVVSPSRAGSLLRGRRLIRNEALFQLPTYLFCLRIH